MNCTVSQKYSCQHEVLLCAVWSGESGWNQVVVGQLPTHMAVVGTSRPGMAVMVQAVSPLLVIEEGG